MQKYIQSITAKITGLFRSFQDIRTVGAVMFLVVALMITWSGINVIETNYRLQREISRLQQENQIKKLINQNMALRNNYLKSDEYLELEARKNLGLAAPGEVVFVVPKNVALRHTVAPVDQSKISSDSNSDPTNFVAWMDFLFHRNSN